MRSIVTLWLVGISVLSAAAATPPATVLTFPANTALVDIDNDFSRLNPAYKQRAGSHYEITYLAKATESLITRAALTNEQKPAAFEILRAFIYDWLHVYVLDAGGITPGHRDEAVAAMDGRFKQLLTSAQLAGYAPWRDAAEFEDNALAFLIRYEPPPRDRDPGRKQP